MDLPIGSIIIWGGVTIPTGWALCNGSNGTPNLTGKFVRGSPDNTKLKTTGGANTHAHGNGGTGTQGGHAHTGISGGSGNSGTEMYYGGSSHNSAANHSHNIGGSVEAIAGHSHSVANTIVADHMPPHKYLQFIMRIS